MADVHQMESLTQRIQDTDARRRDALFQMRAKAEEFREQAKEKVAACKAKTEEFREEAREKIAACKARAEEKIAEASAEREAMHEVWQQFMSNRGMQYQGQESKPQPKPQPKKRARGRRK